MFSYLKNDVPASLVVFLVALPLCLGISLASGAPLYSGIIAGIIGGIVVGGISKSQLSVSGPAAGLAVIVFMSINEFKSFPIFLLAVFFAGIIQVLFGVFRLGIIGYWFPSSVIKGMLAAIGLILILKQIPHAIGFDKDFEGDESFFQPDNQNTLSEIVNACNYISPGAIIISVTSLLLLLFFDSKFIKKISIFKYLPGSLIVVVLSILMDYALTAINPQLSVKDEHLVNIPVASGINDFIGQFTMPNFSAVKNFAVYVVALKLAVVASLETLLSVEAADKIDPYKRVTPTNRELIAQGTGNMVSGLIGGLPITAVIVRTSANVNAGAKTKLSAIIHGFWLLIAVIFIPRYLNLIPLSALAAILLLVGYKLCKPALFKDAYKNGMDHFIPFVITVVAILLTDLLIGIGIGFVVAIFYIARSNFNSVIRIHHKENNYLLRFNTDVSFLNKAILIEKLEEIPDDVTLVIDMKRCSFVDKDILEVIENFKTQSELKNIKLIIEQNDNQK